MGLILMVIISALCCTSVLAKESQSGLALLEAISKYDSCVIESTYSFLYPSSRPPTNLAELKANCERKSEAFKCVRERTRGGPSLVRRGLLSFVQNNQRHHKKVCGNLQSEASRKFLEASKCMMEKRFKQFRQADQLMLDNLWLIFNKNYNDSAPELKQFCCTMFDRIKQNGPAIGQECASYAPIIEEMPVSAGTNDLALICEEEERLAKTCANLQPIKLDADKKKIPQFAANSSAAMLGIYLMATLGEAY